MRTVERVVIGGGVLRRTSLYPKIRAAYLRILNGYLDVRLALPMPVNGGQRAS